MTRTLETLLLTTLVTLAACDASDDAESRPRDKILYTDPASLDAIIESDSEIQDMVAAQLEMDGDRLLDMALDPDASPDLVLTAPPSPSAAESCVGLNDFLDFCYETSGSGMFLWIEVLGVSSGKDYIGSNGACDSGGLDVGVASAEYVYCYLRLPVDQVIVVAEACFFGDCEDVAYVEVLD
jgi:hypothetical protein